MGAMGGGGGGGPPLDGGGGGGGGPALPPGGGGGGGGGGIGPTSVSSLQQCKLENMDWIRTLEIYCLTATNALSILIYTGSLTSLLHWTSVYFHKRPE